MKDKRMMVILSSKQNIDDLMSLIAELNKTTCRGERIEINMNLAECDECGCLSTDVEWAPLHPEDDAANDDGLMLCKYCNHDLNG